jgi:hypothetical protein
MLCLCQFVKTFDFVRTDQGIKILIFVFKAPRRRRAGGKGQDARTHQTKGARLPAADTYKSSNCRSCSCQGKRSQEEPAAAAAAGSRQWSWSPRRRRASKASSSPHTVAVQLVLQTDALWRPRVQLLVSTAAAGASSSSPHHLTVLHLSPEELLEHCPHPSSSPLPQHSPALAAPPDLITGVSKKSGKKCKSVESN